MGEANKPVFPPLFPPGVHPLTFRGLEERLTAAFPKNERRKLVWERFKAFLQELQSLGIEFRVYADGSFVTESLSPEDVDIFVTAARADVEGLTQEQQTFLLSLFAQDNLAVVKHRYLTHPFFAAEEDEGTCRRWISFFSSARDDSPKGLPCFDLTPGDPL